MGAAFAIIINPVVGVTMGVSILAGGLHDLKRRRRGVSSPVVRVR